MGLLGKEYYDNLLKEESSTSFPSAPIQITPQDQPSVTPTQPIQTEPSSPFPRLTPEEQTEKFGGVVGSPEYQETKNKQNQSVLRNLPGEFASAFGIQLPKDEVWDTMTTSEKIPQVAAASIVALKNAIFGLPKVVANIPIGVYNTAKQGWGKITKGTPLVEQEPMVNKLTGEVPSYFKTFDEAKAKGMGNLGASIMTFGRASGDFLIGKDVTSALRNSFAPRSIPLKPGEIVADTTPIQQILTKEQNKLSLKRPQVDNPSEYHPLTNTDAKSFAGIGANSGNTFFKFTPAVADGSKVELSIVKINSGVSNFMNKIFKKEFSNGKFGPETKVYSKIIDVGKPTIENIEIKPTIPSAPLKGFENKLIEDSQLKNLDAISKANNIDPGITEGVVKALTGKDVVGELTQAEYVNVAKTISNLSKAGQYAPEAIGFGNWIKNYLSPTRYWTRDVQEATGLPIHDAHMQLETGSRLAKVSEKTQLSDLYSNPVIEKYAGSQYAGERALVKEYMEGNKKAIIDNPSLSSDVKAELIQSAEIFDTYLKKVAQDIGMDPEVFLENYAPHVQERGGVFQLYKEKGNIPSGSEAFFREKRQGGLFTQIDDMWALADIYTRSAYKSKYMAPVLDSINSFKDTLPGPIKERFSSYVQEKLGYGDNLSRVMDSIAGSLNKKLGWNLPPDTARVFTNQALNTMYSSAMSQPATWLRNAFQYPTLGYAYWGNKFMGEALKKAYSKEGMAEFLKSGFATDLGVPFGEEIAKGETTMGKIGNTYRDVTQSILKPNQWVENRNRAPMYFQTKAIFEDTISKVNSGKLTWVQAEKALGLDKMNQIDANMIRQDLTQGKLKEASDKLIQNAIDDTQFPYRRGESARFQYGMTGKLMTPFMQWPNEYIHTIGKWVGTGQWEKLGRLYASTSLISRTFKEAYNTDFSKSLGLNPMLNINLTPPPIAVMQNGLGLIYNKIADNEQAYEKNGEELFKSLKLAIPAGVEASNIIKAYQAYKRGKIGLEDKPYGVKNSNGNLDFYSFKDLFWNALGMPTLQKTEYQNQKKDMSQDTFEINQADKKVLGLYQDGMSLINAGYEKEGNIRLNEANKIIDEWVQKGEDLTPTDKQMNDYYIPANEKTYNALRDSLKAKYAPRVFSSPNK